MTGFAKALEADLAAVRAPSNAKALYPLVSVPEEDIATGARTALQFARLLNEARILLEAVYENSDTLHRSSDVAIFLDKCREQVGPIIRAREPG